MTKWGMAINKTRCIGCQTCAFACKMENNVPSGLRWNRVLTEGCDVEDGALGTYPALSRAYLPIACQHCENPACEKVCPTRATYKDDKGRVLVDYDKCIGCRMCMAACPYTGVRSFNWEEPKYPVDHAVGDADVPKHQKHVVEKCTFCYQRLAREEVPACMELCPARARHFGDFDDPDSEVSKLVKERSCEQLLASEGTKPSVYYLV